MVHRLAPRARRSDEDGKVPLGRLLPDEFAEAPRTQRRVRITRLAGGRVQGDGLAQNGFTV